MRTFIGIDLGSTTTKALLMDENQVVLGRGITNSRSNYDVAAAVSKQEAKIGARFTLFRQEPGDGVAGGRMGFEWEIGLVDAIIWSIFVGFIVRVGCN